jgi:hypothetical protein
LVEQLRTVDIVRPNAGKRYSYLPVDHVDVTGFHTDYAGSPLQPQLLDIRTGDLVYWYDDDARFQARVDEIVIDGTILRVAFADVAGAPPPW